MKNLKALKQQTTDMEAKLKEMKAEIERMENGWEMKCPYRERDEYFLIDETGSLIKSRWDGWNIDKDRFSQGNIFPTKKAAELEAKRRNLLTRFRSFRDECNGDWNVDWSNQDKKWEINYKEKEFKTLWSYELNSFPTFGHFKNEQDAKRAVDLFGDEIKELFVEGE